MGGGRESRCSDPCKAPCDARSARGHLQGGARDSGFRLVPGSENLLILLDKLPVGNVRQELEPEHRLPFWSSRSGAEYSARWWRLSAQAE